MLQHYNGFCHWLLCNIRSQRGKSAFIVYGDYNKEAPLLKANVVIEACRLHGRIGTNIKKKTINTRKI